MIHLNNDKKNNNRIIPPATIVILAIMMATSTIAAPVAATTTTATMQQQPVTVATDNQSVNVLISWEPTVIEPGQDTEFILDFQDPSTAESISHVNYNFEIIDQNGNPVESMTDLHSHSGTDEQTVTFDSTGGFNFVVTIIGTGIDPPFDTTQSGTAQTVIPVGQQIAGPTGGNDTAGTTVNMTASTGGVAAGAQSACDPTQITGGGGGGQNATVNTTTTGGVGGGTNATAGNDTTTATTGAMIANATTTGEGGNQTTSSSPTQLIEQACMAALNSDTQGVLMNLNLALNALGGNMTTATADNVEVEVEGEEEAE